MRVTFACVMLFTLLVSLGSVCKADGNLKICVKKNDTKQLDKLLRDGYQPDFREDDGSTPLMLAALRGNIAAANILIRHGADVNATTKNGLSVLMIAAGSDSLDMVKLLLKAGANKSYELDGRNACYVAKQLNRSQAVGYLCSSSEQQERQSGSFRIYKHDTSPGYKDTWFANCEAGGGAYVYLLKDYPNIYHYGGPNGRGGTEPGIGIDAALRKACGGQ